MRQRLRRNRHHVTLLAFVAPDFSGRHAAFFKRYGAQVKTGAASGVVDEFGEGVGQAARPYVVNRQDRIGRAELGALVDDFLGPAFNFRVAALHGIKVEMRRIGARGHGAGRAAAHADAHAGAAQLDQQRARGKANFVGEPGVNRAHATGQHDGLVVAPALAANGLLVFPKVACQIGSAKLIVEGGAAERTFRHDLKRAGNVLRFAVVTVKQS